MRIESVPWAAVPSLAQVLGPDGAPVTVLPAHPLATHRALKDAAGAVHVIGVDPRAPVRMLVTDLADALIALKRGGFDFTFLEG